MLSNSNSGIACARTFDGAAREGAVEINGHFVACIIHGRLKSRCSAARPTKRAEATHIKALMKLVSRGLVPFRQDI